MAVHRTLYQVLGVGSIATPEEIQAAFNARNSALQSAGTPEAAAERSLLKDALEILTDDNRRKAYDAQLKERARRAMASGGEPERIRPANAGSPSRAGATESPGITWQRFAVFAVIAVAGIAGAWIYVDHQRKVEALRIERERLAAEERRRADERARMEQNMQRHGQTVDWAKDRFEEQQRLQRDRIDSNDRERARRQAEFDASRQRMAEQSEQRRADADARRADYDRQRQEQEDRRRSQQQLERERRMLQEADRNRGMKF